MKGRISKAMARVLKNSVALEHLYKTLDIDNPKPIKTTMNDNLIIPHERYDLEQEILDNYKKSAEFHDIKTYDMVQTGYPYPNHGEMVERQSYGGTNENNELLPPTGMWCKVEDALEYIWKPTHVTGDTTLCFVEVVLERDNLVIFKNEPGSFVKVDAVTKQAFADRFRPYRGK